LRPDSRTSGLFENRGKIPGNLFFTPNGNGKGDRQIILDKPYFVKYAGKYVLMFYLAKKRRRTCPG
jgi:hypothetical protein